MTDLHTENARLRAALEAMLHRHILYCGGESMAFAGHTDVALFQEARAALATPAPDAPVVYTGIDLARDGDTHVEGYIEDGVFHETKRVNSPAPDAVQEAVRVPEIAALIEAADNLMLNYLQDELCEPDLCVDDEHWAAMTEINNGGPAFPDPARAGGHCMKTGMTLRDWFAAQANEQDINHWSSGWVKSHGREVVKNFSREEARYRFADAMLAARARNLNTGT